MSVCLDSKSKVRTRESEMKNESKRDPPREGSSTRKKIRFFPVGAPPRRKLEKLENPSWGAPTGLNQNFKI